MRTDLSSALNRTDRLKQQLPSNVSEKPKDTPKSNHDAVIVHFGTEVQPKTADIAETYTPAKVKANALVNEPKPAPPVFEPGKEYEGVYRNGHFKTEDGHSGTYFSLGGNYIGFKVGGFEGILRGNKAVAFNRETGESYSMDIRYGKGQFKISNVQEYKAEPFEPGDRKPIVVEGRNPNIEMKYNDAGEINVKVKLPDSEETLEGNGTLLPNGTFMISFSNGSHITGNYAFNDDGKLMIFNRYEYANDAERTSTEEKLTRSRRRTG